jgi:phosphate uptake regulator
MAKDPVEDAEEAIRKSTQGVQASLKDMGTDITDMLEDFDGSAEASKKLAAATAQYYDAVVKVIAAIKQMQRQATEYAASSAADMRYQTITDPQGRYNYAM